MTHSFPPRRSSDLARGGIRRLFTSRAAVRLKTARIRMVVQKITILVDKADDDVERLPEICRTGFERAVNDWRAEHLDDDRWFAIFGRFSVLQVRLPLHEHSGPKIHFPTGMQAMVDSARRNAVLQFRIAIFVGGRRDRKSTRLNSSH